jgi:large subunit ribosomal protein L9
MSAEVLLMTDVKDLGAEGDIVTVADGFARNYLLPRKLAAPVTEATRRRLEKIRREREDVRKAELEEGRALAAKLEGISLTIAVKVSEADKMFGSVSVADLASLLEEQGFSIDRNNVLLDAPIKDLGVYTVKIKVHPEVESSVKVWVVEE